jgi:hypothetical protein
METLFPQDIKLPVQDSTNDRIWQHLHGSTKPLEDLCPSKFCIPKIIEELKTGCSPCPDILTGSFGREPSVLFVSTVYGLINKYLKKDYVRSKSSWNEFVREFYDNLIIPNKGIYGRLGKVYDQVSSTWNCNPEFCLTELVKTVLVDKDNKVSGLESQGSFVEYFINNELTFLQERLSKVENKCIIFTFSEVPTFYTMTSLIGIEDPIGVSGVPEEFEIIHGNESGIKFESKKRGKDKIQISISSSGETFSKSIPFNTLFKMKDRDIFVLPLPHPSGANNRNWPKDRWTKLETLIGLTK